MPKVSNKNTVRLERDRVVKIFHGGRGRARRFARESAALGRLVGIDGFPVLLESDADARVLQVRRIEGVALPDVPPREVPDAVFASLRRLVEAMIERGVARHSLPARDVLVRPDGSAALVDFERTRMRGRHTGPLWWGACQVTRFQLLRLIQATSPHLLTEAEQRRLHWQLRVRTGYRALLDLRRRLLRG